MRDEQKNQPRDSSFTEWLTSHPPSRKTAGLVAQISLIVVVFLIMAGALVLAGWMLT